MAKKIFVSYSRKDSDFTVELANDLTNQGVSVWLDQRDIKTGQLWDKAVQEALQVCEYFLVVLSPSAVESDNVLDEVAYARSKGKQIFPVLYQPCEIPFRLGRFQYIDFQTGYSAGLTKLVDEFKSAGLPVTPVPSEVEPLSGMPVGQQVQVQPLSEIGAGVGVITPLPPIQNITNQLTRDPSRQFPTRPLNQIQRIVIHHTAIPPTVGAERIANHRVDNQGWPGIGYHYFITGEGIIQQTNELTTQSNHAGEYDPEAIGVGFAGDFTRVAPSPAQIDAGAQLIAWLLRQFNLPIGAVNGYKELVITQSPGNQWDSGARWGGQLRQQIQAYMSSESFYED